MLLLAIQLPFQNQYYLKVLLIVVMAIILCCISFNWKIRYILHAISILFADNRPSISTVYDNNDLPHQVYTQDFYFMSPYLLTPFHFFAFVWLFSFMLMQSSNNDIFRYAALFFNQNNGYSVFEIVLPSLEYFYSVFLWCIQREMCLCCLDVTLHQSDTHLNGCFLSFKLFLLIGWTTLAQFSTV
jgi:hypothetical protein